MDTGIKNVNYNESAFHKWEYVADDGKKYTARTLKDLKSNILILGLKWEITNQNLADKSSKIDKPASIQVEKNLIHTNIVNHPSSQKNKTQNKISRARIVHEPKTDIDCETGFKNVKLDKLNKKWIYDDGNKKIHRKYLWKLEEDVINQNLEWTITNHRISDKYKLKEYDSILSYSFSRFYKFLKENYESFPYSHKLNMIIEEYEIIHEGTGILFVTPIANETGNNWRYKNFKDDSWIYAQTLTDLEKSIKDNDLDRKIIDYPLYKKSLKRDKDLINRLNKEISIQKESTQTGFFRVSFDDGWEYNYSNSSEKRFKIKKRTISLLKKEVLNMNLPWIIVNPELAEKSELKDKQLIKEYENAKKIKEEQERIARIEKNKKLKEVADEKYEVKPKNLDKMFR